MAKVVGIGVFIKAAQNKELCTWYKDVLGLDMDPDWGGVAFEPASLASVPGANSIFSIMPADSTYFEPSSSPYMLNLVVDDIDAMTARIEASGRVIGWRDDNTPFGRFAHFLDPNGTKIELWQPKPPETKPSEN
jgi:predicted enzyme related to lactoylglutathione lyase